MDDLEQKFKVLEREHEDLHASYRRLRGARAVEARESQRGAVEAVQHPDRAATGGDSASPRLSKDELRRRYLVVGTRKLGGNSEFPDEAS
jgi:hypothetical protein